MKRITVISFAMVFFFSCGHPNQDPQKVRTEYSEKNRHLVTADGEPFFWLGGTVWGMSEWMTREDIDYYLDDRSDKGFSVVQVCLLWGKRSEHPTSFALNAENVYGHRALREINGEPDPTHPWIEEGGTPNQPNDYWDHVDYLVEAMAKRNMVLALLPVWGRRYVNATHPGFSMPIFGPDKMHLYGQFLGQRYASHTHIIWVLGGDVKADHGADHRSSYRAMAEGILEGVTGERVAWSENSPLWDHVLMTYHPDGAPMINSSSWFHTDPWLDFNMIETFVHKDAIVKAVRQDYSLAAPIKPSIMGEPAYEGQGGPGDARQGIHMRRQAYQSFFSGAAGFTYGGYYDEKNNGPLFSPFGAWREMLDLEGARSMTHLKSFCLTHDWYRWIPDQSLIEADTGKGQFEQVAVTSTKKDFALYYLPENRLCKINVGKLVGTQDSLSIQWFDPSTGKYGDQTLMSSTQLGTGVSPPAYYKDALLVISAK
ncbi:MAG: DUF4038 domain-containing protein [Saprospiraceae bacterium]|nr:DUF4038 domain-containing protein [Saprospiraceae bacterium]